MQCFFSSSLRFSYIISTIWIVYVINFIQKEICTLWASAMIQLLKTTMISRGHVLDFFRLKSWQNSMLLSNSIIAHSDKPVNLTNIYLRKGWLSNMWFWTPSTQHAKTEASFLKNSLVPDCIKFRYIVKNFLITPQDVQSILLFSVKSVNSD